MDMVTEAISTAAMPTRPTTATEAIYTEPTTETTGTEPMPPEVGDAAPLFVDVPAVGEVSATRVIRCMSECIAGHGMMLYLRMRMAPLKTILSSKPPTEETNGITTETIFVNTTPPDLKSENANRQER